MGLRDWLQARRRRREILRRMDDAFRDSELLRGTSLRPRHGSRYVILDSVYKGDVLREIHFGIVRHPRPYSFSQQHHKVAELYIYDLENRVIRVIRGDNWTRRAGRDDD